MEYSAHQVCADILAKTKVTEEATVRKAGGKYKMLPLFDETTAKIKTVQ
jgi:obg-like ATPase 1